MLWYCGKVKEIVFISLGIKDIFILTASLGITETPFFWWLKRVSFFETDEPEQRRGCHFSTEKLSIWFDTDVKLRHET